MLTQAQDTGSSESHSLSVTQTSVCLQCRHFSSTDHQGLKEGSRKCGQEARSIRCVCIAVEAFRKQKGRNLSSFSTQSNGTNGASLVVSCSQTCEVIVKPCTSMEAVLRIFFRQICEANRGKSGQANAKATPMLILRPGKLN